MNIIQFISSNIVYIFVLWCLCFASSMNKYALEYKYENYYYNEISSLKSQLYGIPFLTMLKAPYYLLLAFFRLFGTFFVFSIASLCFAVSIIGNLILLAK